MTEGTKALHQAVSTLKKNPERVSRLVKRAGIRIVPPRQYASGPTRASLESAVSKLKARRGLNGVTGEGAGPFAKSAEMSEKTKNRVIAGGAVLNGAAIGGILGSDMKKSRVTSRVATKGAYKHMSDGNVRGAEKRLARAGKIMGRMKKPIQRAGIKGGILGAAIGAGLGAAHMNKQADVVDMAAERKKRAETNMSQSQKTMRDAKRRSAIRGETDPKVLKAGARHIALKGAARKVLMGAGALGATAATAAGLVHLKKQASVLNSRTLKQRAAQAFQQMRKNDARRAEVKKSAKGMALAAGVYGSGIAVTHKNEKLKKQAAELVIKDGKKYRKGTVNSASIKMGLANTARHLLAGKRKATDLMGAAANGLLLGEGYGAARGANRLRKGEISLNGKEMRNLKKQAAEMITRDGKKYRKGTVTSAAATMAGVNSGIQLSHNLIEMSKLKKAGVSLPRGAILTKLPHTAVGGALMGAAYAGIRGHFRKKRGEHSVTPSEFAKLKAGK